MDRRCLADISGPFYNPNKPFRNWSTLPFYQLDLPEPPFVDRAQLRWGIARAEAYLEQIHAQGYTGIVIDNLAHLVGFANAPVQIYTPDSPYRRRATQYREAFEQLFSTAMRLDMEVFVSTDMQWSTPPIRRYVGRLSVHNPRLAHVNRWALTELFTLLPQVRGVVVRIGEAGGAHNLGQDYTGHLLYTTPQHLQHLIDSLLPVCADFDRLFILRTWSIGIGELGDLLWSPQRYQEVFGTYDSPHLLVSVKHGPSDFFRFLPHNPTLGLAGPAQIIELQNRREYELFGMVPSSVALLHQEVVRYATATNPRFAGVWAWNSSGGWGGGRAVLATDGWSFWTELSSALTAALVHTPDSDPAVFVHRWCCDRLGDSFGAAVAEVYCASTELIEHGWYLGPLTQQDRKFGSIYLPSLLWVWWMRPTAAPIVWAYLVSALPHSAEVVRRGEAVQARVATYVEHVSRLVPIGDAQAATIVESVCYLRDVLHVAQAIRTLMLHLFTAAWQGDKARWRAIASGAIAVQTIIHRHCATWAYHADFPPLELAEIDDFLTTLSHTPQLCWLQARVACLVVRRLRTGKKFGRHVRGSGMLVAAVLVGLLFYEGHPRCGAAGVLASMLYISPLRHHAIRLLMPWLSQRLNVLPSIFYETGPSLTEWTT